jgi:hypothetical protein
VPSLVPTNSRGYLEREADFVRKKREIKYQLATKLTRR